MIHGDLLLRIYINARLNQPTKYKPIRNHYNIRLFG
mgnify:CR=1 FL=1